MKLMTRLCPVLSAGNPDDSHPLLTAPGHFSRQSGLSLVELMVAVVIGLVGILAMTQAYITSDRFNRATMGEGSAQTNGLIAMYQLERDLRMSGYGIANSTALGCGQIRWFYTPNYSTNINASSTLPVITLAPVVITTSGTDPHTITTFFSTVSEQIMPTVVANFTAATNKATLDGAAAFSAGDLLLFVTRTLPTTCAFGRITSKSGQEITMASGVAGGQFNPAAWASFPTYASDDSVLNLGFPAIRTYSITSRKLRVTDLLDQAAGQAPIDVVDGIVDMRAQYGKDNGGGGGTANDGVVDEYNSTTPTTTAEWQQVLSIRLAVLARVGTYEKPATGTDCDATTATNAPTWSGGSFANMDFATTTSEDRCYRYRVYESNVPLRNMIWRAL